MSLSDVYLLFSSDWSDSGKSPAFVNQVGNGLTDRNRKRGNEGMEEVGRKRKHRREKK